MRTLEIAGPVGAGKTSLVAPLRACLNRSGRDALTMDEALSRAEVGMTRWAHWWYATRFVARHPALLASAAWSLLRAPLPWWHRRRIIALILKLGLRLELLEARLPPAATVIVDEGWLHRALNIFAWRVDEVPTSEIEAYLDRAPLSEIVIFVHASPEVMRLRAEARGLPKRLEGKSAEEVAAFLGRGERILTNAAGSLRERPRGVRVLDVVNDRRVEDLLDELDGIFGDGVGHPLVRYRQRWPSVPRLDRVLSRAGRRRTSMLDPDVARKVAGAAGMSAPIVVPAVISPGGRGAVQVVRDSGGNRWLVKRYKETLHDADIAVELAVLKRLAELNLPAPRLAPVIARTASPICIGDDRYAVYELVPGYFHPHERALAPPDRRRLERLAGELLAIFHTELHGFEPAAAADNGFVSLDGPRVRPTGWFTERLRADGVAHAAFAAREAAWMSDELSRLDRELEQGFPERTVIHGDYGPYNLLVRGGRSPIAIDWELARIDWRVTDIVTAIPRFASRRSGWDVSAARRFLAGYRRHSDIRSEEITLLPAVAEYLALRRAVVCAERARHVNGGWRIEARERLGMAFQLSAGRHPLARLGEW